MTTWAALGLQDSASPLMEQLTFFHDHALMILVMITTLVGYLMFMLFFNSYTNRNLLHGQTIEMIWTILPAIVLLFIAFPSLRLLYLLDEINEPSVTLKAIGHQWYWSYEYSDFMNVEFDSYMVPTNELATDGFRLLDVDNRVVLPMNSQIRILVTAADVIHSWTVPALGVKVDGTPGRLNQTNFLMNRPGLFYGQCSEICGANHSFMPIVIESLPVNHFIKWVTNSTNS
ncbi:cytochrome c oxidase subunit II (mitochondrion) [Bactrocera dorsalis]|uniref:Cytochrome c oxidase subunit 2 n=46 Tax=Bactrocera TaxID=47832 RepID=A1Y996_BACDO|nr:cytochrome c oxidase subunit II [Bactrocera carambolae]YP_009755808.1 cytochrome c oxidase subunit II [Bactrocera ruiliensis]YP_010037302.1 cytochrome c oxidase subunit II [Bactrocera thailandica]YP_010693271.1 cytochrome c oxidase subunit II [Bactrocera occipitalis]YP_961384.1 cytochrome c oxidase subunit II [Bactrocera dorsalis]ADF97750.1 cytochrome oxidase subunit 2 [Bactrocera jarvisi]WBK17757.1 cytochrome c oxidase subunit 2 [Bactrocera zonata]ABG91548.1 cytochrome c oxydase subunit 